MSYRHCLLGLGLLAAVSLAQADTTLSMKNTETGAPAASYAMTAEHIRIDTRGEDGSIVLYDRPSDTITILNTERKAYVKLDPATRAKVRKKVEAIVEKLKNMPPEQRRMMSNAMGGILDSDKQGPTLKSTGESRKVAGYDCDVFQVVLPGDDTYTVCNVAPDKLGISNAELATMKRFMHALQESTGPLAQSFDKFIDKGIPVQSETNDGKQTLDNVSHSAIPADTFKVPEGYKEQTPMSAMGD